MGSNRTCKVYLISELRLTILKAGIKLKSKDEGGGYTADGLFKALSDIYE